MVNLILVELRKRRNSILGWGIGMGAYLALILALSPQLTAQFSNIDLSNIPAYQAFGINTNINTIAQLIALYLPFIGLLIGAYGVVIGSLAIAGEEEDGSLEMLVALPMSRWTIIIAKGIAIAVAILGVLTLCFIGFAIVYLISDQLDETITLGRLAAATFEPFGLGLSMAMITLCVSMVVTHRIHALWIGLAMVISSYLFNNIANATGRFEAGLPFQPFYYYAGGDVLTNGFYWSSLLILIGLSLLFFGLATLLFSNRNIITNWK